MLSVDKFGLGAAMIKLDKDTKKLEAWDIEGPNGKKRFVIDGDNTEVVYNSQTGTIQPKYQILDGEKTRMVVSRSGRHTIDMTLSEALALENKRITKNFSIILAKQAQVLEQDMREGNFTTEKFSDWWKNVKKGNWKEAARFIPKQLLEQIPYMASNLFTAGTYTILSEGGNIYQDIIIAEAAKELGIKEDAITGNDILNYIEKHGDAHWEKAMTAGSFIAAAERAGIGLMISKGKYMRNAFKEIMKKDFLQGMRQIGNSSVRIAQAGAGEGLTEGIQTGIEQITKGVFDGQEYIESMGTGTLMGIILPTGGALVSSTVSNLNSIAKTIVIADPDIRAGLTQTKNFFKQIEQAIDTQFQTGVINREQKINALKDLSSTRNAAANIPKGFDRESRAEALDLLKERSILENQIEKQDEAFSINDKKRIEEINQRLEILGEEQQVKRKQKEEEDRKNREETVGMGVIPTRRTKTEEVSAQEQAELNQISIDLYKESTDETTRNAAIKDIIEDNAGFFLSDKGGINFDANFKGYINKNTGKPISPQEVLNEINAEIPSIINAFTQDKGANFTTYAGIALNKRLPKILESLIGAKEAATTKEMTAEEMAQIPEQKTETQETQDKEFETRKYPTDIAAIEKQTANVRPEILTNIKNSVKQFIASSVGKVKEIGGKGKTVITKLDPSSLAKELKAQNKATETAVRNAMGKTVKAQNDFIKKVINDGYIETIPIAAMKKRFKTVKGFNIEKIGRETLGAGTGIYKLSGLQEQALIDFYTKDQSGRRSFIDLLAKGLTIEQFQEVKIDPGFMKDLAFKLKEANSELTAEEFMNEVERSYDGRTREFASLDKTESLKDKPKTAKEAAEKAIEEIITEDNIDNFKDKDVLDKAIEYFEGIDQEFKNTLGANPIQIFIKAIKVGLKAIRVARDTGKTYLQSLKSGSQAFTTQIKGILPSQKSILEAISIASNYKAALKILWDGKIIQPDSLENIQKIHQRDLETVLNGNIGTVVIEKSNFGNFGAKVVPGNMVNGKFVPNPDSKVKYYELFNDDGSRFYVSYPKKGSKNYVKRRQAIVNNPKYKGKFVPDTGAYYGKSDPAYEELLEAAKENDGSDLNKQLLELKPTRIVIPTGKRKIGKRGTINKDFLEDNADQIAQNQKALRIYAKILEQSGQPLSSIAPFITASYQATTGLIKISAGFKGASKVFRYGKERKHRKGEKYREEHSPPASVIGATLLWAIKYNHVDITMDAIVKNYGQIQLSKLDDARIDNSGLAATLPEGMTIFDDNVDLARLAASDVNLNTIINPKTKETLVSEMGLGLNPIQAQNPSLVHYQNMLVLAVVKGEISQTKASKHLKVSIPANIAKNTKVKWNAKNLAPEFLSKNQRTDQQKEDLENSLDTQVDAQKVKKKRKGISVFDFDDTLAKTTEQVLVSMPDGTLRRLSPAQFAEQAQTLEEQGATFDFSQFENVKGAKKGPLADLALRRQGKFGSGDIFVLTARPQISAQGIKAFLDGIGLNIPLENITGLEDGTSQAKARWVLTKTEKGYNDFYFADDAIQNVKAVKQILDQVDVKSKVQQAIADKEITLDTEFNKIVEETTGLKAEAVYSPVRARLEGRKKDKGFFKWLGKQLTITPSAEDFMGLMYDLMGSGKQGNRHAKWIRDNLINPYNKAEQQILSAKVTVANDFAALKKAFPSLRSSLKGNPLMDQIGVGPYTKSQAMRVYIWNKQGMEIPGLSKRDQNALVAAVEANSELNVFADEVILIQKDKQYPAPTDNWAGGTIDSDLMSSIDKTFRRQVMTEFDENTKIIFSDKNMNKLEALYGKKWADALKDSLRRMKSGSNRPVYQGGGARIVNEMLDWLNGSVGAVMFLNVKSGLLQLISNVNFINWGDNNIYQAAKAFASKEYWPTVMKLMNSDYLVNRRDGLRINVNEAELANAAKDGGMKGAIAYLLDKGFIITRIMDSLAIATGGATFYMNRRDALLKRQNPETGKKYTQAEAEAKAFDDFYAISEESQQSSNPSKISQQQASLFGRVILAFQNVTMQYNRMTKKSIRNLYNRRKSPGQTQRESDLGNLSKIIYYTTIQNIIFNALQQTLFAMLFDDEGEEKEKDKLADVANGMADSLLFGLGFGGAAISTVKNVLIVIAREAEKKSPDFEEAVWEVFNVSPVLDSKIRKLRTTAKTFSWNMEEIKKRGWSLDNPTYLAVSQLISAATNIPIDRVLRKMMNLRMAMDEETRTWQRVALILGWSPWSLGLPYWGLQSTIDQEEKAIKKAKNDYKYDIRKLKAQGYKKVMYRNLKDFDPKDIVELQSPAGTVVYYVKTKKK